jgi:hypothetical protein
MKWDSILFVVDNFSGLSFAHPYEALGLHQLLESLCRHLLHCGHGAGLGPEVSVEGTWVPRQLTNMKN